MDRVFHIHPTIWRINQSQRDSLYFVRRWIENQDRFLSQVRRWFRSTEPVISQFIQILHNLKQRIQARWQQAVWWVDEVSHFQEICRWFRQQEVTRVVSQVDFRSCMRQAPQLKKADSRSGNGFKRCYHAVQLCLIISGWEDKQKGRIFAWITAQRYRDVRGRCGNVTTVPSLSARISTSLNRRLTGEVSCRAESVYIIRFS